MRTATVAAAVTLLLLASAVAPARAFDDVPPWHWAFDGVQKAATAGVVVGYPRVDRESAINAVIQVYEAFANPTHPAAQAWAERFAGNLPTDWPEPLRRSPVQAFRLEGVRAVVAGDRATVVFVAAVAQRPAGGGSAVEARAQMRVAVRRDGEGRWRVNYADLAAGQPAIFR
jgi:hypothetical protein